MGPGWVARRECCGPPREITEEARHGKLDPARSRARVSAPDGWQALARQFVRLDPWRSLVKRFLD